jgi:hypothetical protein
MPSYVADLMKRLGSSSPLRRIGVYALSNGFDVMLSNLSGKNKVFGGMKWLQVEGRSDEIPPKAGLQATSIIPKFRLAACSLKLAACIY